MKNSTNYNELQFNGLNDIVEIGLNAASETLAKILNNEVIMSADEMLQEKASQVVSFGGDQGVAVTINVTGALSGRIFVLMQSDYMKSILNMLMNDEEQSDEDKPFDEISLETFKELVNQMAGAFAAAITDFFGVAVNAEAVFASEMSGDVDKSSAIQCSPDDELVSIVTGFSITNVFGGSLNIECDRDITTCVLSRITAIPGSEGEQAVMNAAVGGNNIAGAAPDVFPTTNHTSTVMRGGISIQSAQFPSFGKGDGVGQPITNGNIDLLMDVPLNVTIEIGKTRKKMRDIMEFSQGTVIDLEKQAGAPVDVVVNGQLIARGDVVVIDDNFGVRITEIIGNSFFEKK